MLVANACDHFIVDSHREKKISVVKLLILLKKLNHCNCYKIKKEKRKKERKKTEKRGKKGTRIGHMTERKKRQNLAKRCNVYFQS